MIGWVDRVTGPVECGGINSAAEGALMAGYERLC